MPAERELFGGLLTAGPQPGAAVSTGPEGMFGGLLSEGPPVEQELVRPVGYDFATLSPQMAERYGFTPPKPGPRIAPVGPPKDYVDPVEQIGQMVVQGFGTMLGSLGAGAGATATEIENQTNAAIDRALGTWGVEAPARDKKLVRDHAAYKLGRRIADWTTETFPGGEQYVDSFLMHDVPIGAGSTGVFLLAGLATGGSLSVVGTLGATTGTGLGYERAIESGASEEDALVVAWIEGAAGVSEAVPICRILDRFNKASGGALRSGLQKVLPVLMGGAEEFTQETFQQVVSNAAIQQIVDEEQELLEGVWRSGGAGGVVGTILSGIMTGVGVSLGNRRRLIAEYEERKAAGQKDPVPNKETREAAGLHATRKEAAEAIEGWIEELKETRDAGTIRGDQAEIPPTGVQRESGIGEGSEDIQRLAEEEGVEVYRESSTQKLAKEPWEKERDELWADGWEADLDTPVDAPMAWGLSEGPQGMFLQRTHRRGGAGLSIPVMRLTGEAARVCREAQRADAQGEKGKAFRLRKQARQLAWEAFQRQREAEARAEAGYEKVPQVGEQVEAPAALPPTPPVGTEGPSPTSIKNAQVDLERAKRGLPPAMKQAKQEWSVAWDEAMRRIDTQPAAQDALVFELAKEPRALTDVEVSLVLHRQIELQNKYDELELEYQRKAEQAAIAGALSVDAAELKDIERHQEMALAELLRLYEITEATGTVAGRGFAARKMFAAEDFSLVRMTAMKRKARGVAQLSAEDAKAVKAAQRQIEELENRLRDHTERIAQLESDNAALRTTKKIVASEKTRPRKRRTAAAKAELEAAWKDFESQIAGKLFANPLDPALIKSAATLAKAYFSVGVATFQDFVDAVATRIGKEQGKKLEETLRRAWDTAVAEQMPRPTKDFEGAEAVSRFARKLAKYFVSTGVTEREALIDAVHGELSNLVPGITRRESMDAISGYGQYSPLSQEALDVLLRDLKGQMQQIAKLEDMQAGQAPLKTGPERRTPSDEERRLLLQVNQMKKQGGFDITDPATQLQSALAAVKTRLRHQIADLEHQIATKEKIVKERTKVPQDEEVQRLTKRRDVLREQFNEIFGKPGLTEEQRVRAATAAVKRSIAEYERRIAERDFTAKRPSKIQATRELQALRDRRDALRAELKEMRDLANPKKTPQERALSALKARLRARIAEYQDRLARRDFAPKVRRKTVLDKEAESLRYQAEQAKLEFLRGLEEDRLKRRSTLEKVFSVLPQSLDLVRALKVSYDISAVARQGAILNSAHPIKGIVAADPMFRSLSAAAASRIENELASRKNAALYKRAKLDLTTYQQLSPTRRKEEVYAGRWSKHVPGIPASERAFVTYLNERRADTFDAMVALHSTDRAITEDEAKVIANYINVATGRGPLTIGFGPELVLNLQGASDVLAKFFWSPRLALSRFQYILLQPLWMKGHTWRTRRMIAVEYARTMTGVVVALSAAAFGLYLAVGPPGEDKEWDIETDPRSSDFGKIRIGKTRIRPLAGLEQATTLLCRLIVGKTKKLGTGEIVPIRGVEVPYGANTGATVVWNFLRNKLAPVPATALNVLAGENVVGERVTPATLTRDLTVPLSFQEILSLMKDFGVPKAVGLQMLEWLGIGVQNYSAELKIDKQVLALDNEHYNEFQRLRHEEADRIMRHWVDRGRLNTKNPTKRDTELIRKAFDQGTRYAKATMIREGLIEMPE